MYLLYGWMFGNQSDNRESAHASLLIWRALAVDVSLIISILIVSIAQAVS